MNQQKRNKMYDTQYTCRINVLYSCYSQCSTDSEGISASYEQICAYHLESKTYRRKCK